jgi:hypothetical protein
MANKNTSGRITTLDRRVAIKAILAERSDALVVTGLGSSSYDVGTVDHPNTYYLWGGITGDGEMLMGLGSLATIGAEKIKNLSICVIDNELYSETGMQPTHTSRGVDLAGIAKAAGFAAATSLSSLPELKTWIPRLYNTAGPIFLNLKVNAARYPLSIRLRDGTHIKNRFRENLLGAKAFD